MQSASRRQAIEERREGERVRGRLTCKSSRGKKEEGKRREAEAVEEGMKSMEMIAMKEREKESVP